MTIAQWPSHERPREKMMAQGSHALSDAELIAILLGHGRRGITAVDLGRELITQFGGLKGLARASFEELHAIAGLGPAKTCRLKAGLELSRRAIQEKLKTQTILTCRDETEQFLLSSLSGRPYEVFACLYLDTHHKVIAFEELFRGSLRATSVYPREVVRQVLHHNAASVIFAHNHPSGNPRPSSADRTMTHFLEAALEYIDVKVLDHVVVG